MIKSARLKILSLLKGYWMSNLAIQVSSEHFARCEKRYEEARLPLAVSVDPFCQDIQCENSVIPKCAKCGMYVSQNDENAYVQTKWKCEFCGHKNETLIPFEFHDAVDFEVQIDELPAHTMFIVDNSPKSQENDFFSTVLGSLNESIPNDMTNFTIGVASDTISYLVHPTKILNIPELTDSTEIPPIIFHKENYKNFTRLLTEKSREEFHLFEILAHLTSVARPNSRIVLFVSSQPYGFSTPQESNFFKSQNIGDKFAPIIQKCQNNNITINILCYKDSYIDVPGLSSLTDLTGGDFVLLEKNQFKDIPQEVNTLCNTIQMRCILKTIKSLRIESSFGFRPRNPDKFSLTSNESVVFPISLVGIGEKSVPFQLIITYITHSGRKRMRVFTRRIDMTDSLALVFNECYPDVIFKFTAAKLAEEALRGEKHFTETVRNILWPIYYDYPVNGLFRNKPEKNKLICPPCLLDLPERILKLLKFSGFSEMTIFHQRLYQLRKLSACRISTLNSIVNAKLINIQTGEESEILENGKIYSLFDGFTTFLWGDSRINGIDQSSLNGAVVLVNSADDAILKERLPQYDSSIAPSLSKFMEILYEDIETQGHKWTLKLTDEEMKQLEAAFEE